MFYYVKHVTLRANFDPTDTIWTTFAKYLSFGLVVSDKIFKWFKGKENSNSFL